MQGSIFSQMINQKNSRIFLGVLLFIAIAVPILNLVVPAGSVFHLSTVSTIAAFSKCDRIELK